MPIQQPGTQIKLTNVSLVRLKKNKKRFEIACYKNKVLEYRSGLETDLDNVLQIHNVFLNVSKGQTAPSVDLAKAFGKDAKVDDIILEILKRGELQVGEKERSAQLERVHNEVVSIVASKLVDPRTKRVYTSGMIDKALDMLSAQAHAHTGPNPGSHYQESSPAAAATTPPTAAAAEEDTTTTPAAPKSIWTGVSATKSAKSQALEAMKALIAAQPIPVARARMKLRITCPTTVLKQGVRPPPKQHIPTKGEAGDDEEHHQKEKSGTVKDKILSFIEQVENQDVVASEWEVIGFVEPGAFKVLSDFIGGETKGQGRIEVLDMAVTHED